MRLKRIEGEWTVLGPSLLLQMEREIHQLARLLGHHPLRLEGFPAYSSILLKPPPPGWMLGPHDAMSVKRPLHLLRERAIDVWLTDAADDLPQDLDFPLTVWPLASQPITLSVDARHPLAGERNVSLSDLLRFPLPIIPAEGFPRSHGILANFGLGSLDVAMRRYDATSWEGMTADAVTLTYTTPLHARAFPSLVPVDAPPLLSNRLALVSRADVSDHAQVQELRCLLLARLQHLSSHHLLLDGLNLFP